MKKYVGIDIGGTNVRCAVITEEGEILAQVSGPSYAQDGREKVLDNMFSLIHQLPLDGVLGIGAGVPGPCDQKTGSMFLSTNLPGFAGFPFAEALSKEFGIPAFIDNDANVAGLAEALLGAGKGKDVVYYVTISTGIGGALIVNGQCVSGKHGFAGEIANIIIDRDRKPVNYLAVGAVENEAGGPAIIRKAEEAFPNTTFAHAGEVFEKAYVEGNEKALELCQNVEKDLAQLFATIAAVVDPDVFVLGGGVTKSANYWLEPMKEYYKEVSHDALHDTEFVLKELDEPGIIGAAMLPKSKGI